MTLVVSLYAVVREASQAEHPDDRSEEPGDGVPLLELPPRDGLLEQLGTHPVGRRHGDRDHADAATRVVAQRGK